MLPIVGKEIPGYGLNRPPLRMRNGFLVQPVDWRDGFLENPAEGEAWADEHAAQYGGRTSPFWRQNYEMELIRGGDLRWPMMRSDIHIRRIPMTELCGQEWTLYRAFDHGIRHPSCCGWFGVSRNGDIYFYRQYYRTDADVPTIVKEVLDMTSPKERVVATVADPSIWRRQAVDLTLLADTYAMCGLPLSRADNTQHGYDTVTARLMSAIARYAIGQNDFRIVRKALNAPDLAKGTIDRMASRPALWFSPDVANGARSIYQETANLRYRELKGDDSHRAKPIKTEDIDDEGPDVVRYAVQTPGIAWTEHRPAVRPVRGSVEQVYHELSGSSGFASSRRGCVP